MGNGDWRKIKPARSMRYCVRAEKDSGGVQEIGLGHDLEAEIAFAKKYYAQHGVNVWVWDLRTGATLWRSPRVAKGAGR